MRGMIPSMRGATTAGTEPMLIVKNVELIGVSYERKVYVPVDGDNHIIPELIRDPKDMKEPLQRDNVQWVDIRHSIYRFRVACQHPITILICKQD